jgi:phosphatidate cytidylyltransferase
MKGRIFSTLTLWILVALTAVYFRAPGAVILAAATALLTQREIYRMLGKSGRRPLKIAGFAIGLAISLSPMLGTHALLTGPALLAPAIILLGIAAILDRPCGEIIGSFEATLLGLILGPCMLSYVGMTIYHFGPQLQGLLMALWVVMAAKFTDMGALLTGMAIGRHKMSPTLSPKKTWEGAVGGIVLCLASSAIYAHYCAPWLPAGFTPLVATLVALPMAVAAIFADLLESAFKRECGIKDSGHLLPGIGGAFDLTDSFMLCAPLAYYMLVLILG